MEEHNGVTLETLLKTQDHRRILQLPSPEYDIYKTVAAIHLEKYRDALLFVEKKSFLHAYILYKLKKFKRSLKILRKLSGKQVEILKSQCLYFLGYYGEAYDVLSKQGTCDEFAVNLSAMKALSLHNGFKPTLFTPKNRKAISSTVTLTYSDAECRFEGEYNDMFRFAGDEGLFIRKLMGLPKIEGSCAERQLKNLMDENIDSPTTREKEIIEFNRGVRTTIPAPCLFQSNFFIPEKINFISEYQIFRDYYTNKDKYISGERVFETATDALRVLKALIIAKRHPNAERLIKICKTIRGINAIEAEILNMLAENHTEKINEEKAMKLFFKASQQ